MALYDGTGKEITISGTSSNPYIGKTALWLGDSISVVGDPSYPKTVCNDLGMTLRNYASSGGNSERMRQILQGTGYYEGQAADLSGVDYVFIMIGHNCDYAVEGLSNTGAVTSGMDDIPTDDTSYADFPTTFHGNVASCVEYIWAQNPAAQIFFLTPIQGATDRYIKTTPLARKALLEIGLFYSIPVIDVYATSGIARKNIGTYTYDDIHPNADGIVRIADCIEGYLLEN
jgi:lysophospholipase L1-like esterase